jgi:hypothetical protein
MAENTQQPERAVDVGSTRLLAEREVAWYRIGGRHADRIKRDTWGQIYVIGDWSWNRERFVEEEYIESRMQSAGVYLC